MTELNVNEIRESRKIQLALYFVERLSIGLIDDPQQSAEGAMLALQAINDAETIEEITSVYAAATNGHPRTLANFNDQLQAVTPWLAR